MKCVSQKAILRKYYFISIFIVICYFAVFIPCIYIYHNIWSIVFCTALFFLVKFLIRIVANKTIASVLFVELDAIGFQELIKENNFLPPLGYRINAALFTGDYQTVVNIVTIRMKKRSTIRVRYLCLSILALAYFELRDFEKLQILLTKYDDYKAKYPSKSLLNSSNSVWSYYRYFLEQNYEACKVVSKERNLGLRPNAWNVNLARLQTDFFYAVACYENGDIEEAKKIFENIISDAPKMNYAVLSQKYCLAIERAQAVLLFDKEILPDANFRILDTKTAAKVRWYKALRLISIAVLVFLLITRFAFPDFEKIKRTDIVIFEEKLHIALQAHYDKYNIISYLNLHHNNELTDSFCFVQNEKGGYDIGFLVTSDKGNTIDFMFAIKDIKCGERYIVKSITGKHSIAIDVDVKRGVEYDKTTEIAFGSSVVSVGFLYLHNTDL